MGKIPKVSIVAPAFNGAKCIEDFIDSILSQNYRNWELIIVDDGSTDNTVALVEQWIKEEKIEIRYYRQKNGGKQRAHNVGVEKSNGEVFVCVDSDDYVLESFVEKNLKCI